MKQAKRSRKALRGLEGMVVWVHQIEDDAAADGLSRQHMQDMAVIKLLDSYIRALGISNVPEPPGNPWLNIFVNTVKHEDRYFYSITVRLDEIVRPERNPPVKIFGATWETSERGVCEASDLAMETEKAIDRLLEYFIYDFQMENQV